MGRRCALLLLVIFCLIFGGVKGVLAQEIKSSPPPKEKAKGLTLVEASVCEKMGGTTPVNRAVVFSLALGKIYCFTAFDPVPRETIIYHKWYRRDSLKTKVRLTLKPPRWSTFSSIRIRKSDLGPWRVDITDTTGRVFRVVRFSVTE